MSLRRETLSLVDKLRLESLFFFNQHIQYRLRKTKLSWFYGCWTEPQGVSAWWKERTQTRSFMLSSSLLLSQLKLQSGEPKLLLPIMLIGLLHFCGTTFVETAVLQWFPMTQWWREFVIVFYNNPLPFAFMLHSH